MTTVAGISARYANFLVHPLLPDPAVCQVCHGPVGPGYLRCWPCHEADRTLGTSVADLVVPVSLALKGRQYANELWRYKNAAGPQRQHFRLGLAAVLWRFLALHENCVAERCEIPAFDVVTTVPSTRGRVDHPLRSMVAETVAVTRERFRDLLVPGPKATSLGRVPSRERYTSQRLRGEHVLLVDDTWTTGSHAQSAAATLKSAGAGRVAVVVLGRHLNIGYGTTASHVEQAMLRRFSWGICVLRDGIHA
ncbi:ComF family protein [Streptomyces sp. JNUCC 64]